VRIGVGERGPLRGRDPQVVELPLAGGQPPADLPQGVGAAQLAEQHSDKLAPAGEAPGVALGPRLLDGPLEVHPREELEELTEDTREPTHC